MSWLPWVLLGLALTGWGLREWVLRRRNLALRGERDSWEGRAHAYRTETLEGAGLPWNRKTQLWKRLRRL